MDKNEDYKNSELYKDINKLVRNFVNNYIFYREQNFTEDQLYELIYLDYEINKHFMVEKYGDFFSFEDFIEISNSFEKAFGKDPQWSKK